MPRILASFVFVLLAHLANSQVAQWFRSYNTESTANPYLSRSLACPSASGFWLAYVREHHQFYNTSHGEMELIQFDEGGNELQSRVIEGDVHMVYMTEIDGTLFLHLSVYGRVRLNEEWLEFQGGARNIFCRISEAGQLTYLPPYGDSISVSTVNRQGAIDFITNTGFGGDAILYEVDTLGEVARTKSLPGIGYVFSLTEKTGAGGYVIGGGCMGEVHFDSIEQSPVADYTNYLLSLNDNLQGEWMRVIEDISCVHNEVWSDGDRTYYAGATAVIPAFDSLAFDGPGGQGYDFFLSRLDGDGFTWVRETPGSGGWVGAKLSSYEGMTVDPEGNIYLLGTQNGDPVTWAPGITTGNRDNHEEVFVLSYSPAGDLRWAKSFSGRWVQEGMSIAVRGVDDVLLTLVTRDTVMLDGVMIADGSDSNVVVKIGAAVTGEENLHDSQELSVYPNPASGLIQLRLPEFAASGTLRVVNAQGLVVSGTTWSDRLAGRPLTVDVSPYPPGIYWLQYFTAGRSGQQSFLIAR